MIVEDKIYPQPVIEVCDKILEVVFDDEYFEENEISDVELGRECATKMLRELFCGKFMRGEVLIFSGEKEVEDLLSTVNAETCLRSLEKKGLIDSLFVPDKDDTVFFLTEKGKLIAEALKKENEDGN